MCMVVFIIISWQHWFLLSPWVRLLDGSSPTRIIFLLRLLVLRHLQLSWCFKFQGGHSKGQSILHRPLQNISPQTLWKAAMKFCQVAKLQSLIMKT